MKIKPVANRVLINFHFPEEKEGDLVLPNSNIDPSIGEKRTKIECLAVGDDVKVCKPGDWLLLSPDAQRNVIGVCKEPPQAIIHDSLILGIILDDSK